MATLTDKVYGQIIGDESPDQYLLETVPADALGNDAHGGDAGDMRGYCLAYGMAWAIARAENPFANNEELREAAHDAAATAWRAATTVGGMEAMKETA